MHDIGMATVDEESSVALGFVYIYWVLNLRLWHF